MKYKDISLNLLFIFTLLKTRRTTFNTNHRNIDFHLKTRLSEKDNVLEVLHRCSKTSKILNRNAN